MCILHSPLGRSTYYVYQQIEDTRHQQNQEQKSKPLNNEHQFFVLG